MKQATLVEKGSHSKSQGPVLPSLPSDLFTRLRDDIRLRGIQIGHFSPNPTASGSKKGLHLRREGGNCPLQRLRLSVARSERASLTIDCPRLTPKS